MPNIESVVDTQRTVSMKKKCLDSNSSTWKILLDNYLSDFCGSFVPIVLNVIMTRNCSQKGSRSFTKNTPLIVPSISIYVILTHLLY